MCSRYYFDDEAADELEKIVRQVDETVREERFGKDIHPTDLAPVIIEGPAGLTLTSQRWGYPGIQNKGVIFNAKAESVLYKKMFSCGICNNRAAIPAAWFYEWNKNREKITFFRKGGKVLYLAGFYDRFDDGNRFVILTTAANDSMIRTHDRMPVTLEPDQLEEWIKNDNQTESILRQVPIMLDKRAEYEQQTLF